MTKNNLTWDYVNWHVTVKHHPVLPLYFGRVTQGSVVQKHLFGITKRQAFNRAVHWTLDNYRLTTWR